MLLKLVSIMGNFMTVCFNRGEFSHERLFVSKVVSCRLLKTLVSLKPTDFTTHAPLSCSVL